MAESWGVQVAPDSYLFTIFKRSFIVKKKAVYMPGCEYAHFSAGACRDHRTVLGFLELDM